MKKLILATLAVFLILNSSYAQTLDEILTKHFKAVGQEKLVSVNSYTIEAKVSQMGMEIPMEMKMKKPDKFRIEMDMQGQKMIQAYDGESGWIIAPWVSKDPQDLIGDQLQQAIEQANIAGELFNYKEKGLTAELIGKEDVDGVECYSIKLVTKSGNVKNYYIDAKKYLITKIKVKVSAMGQEVEVVQKMSDYLNINGVLMAMKIESVTPMGIAQVVMEKITFNQEIDDSIFKRPSN